MWLSNDSAQTAETTSLNPWNMEQQNRWGNVGAPFGNVASCDERMRSILPPAFRNGNAKVVYQDPKLLEANVNEALGITSYYGAPTPNSQFGDQSSLNVSIQPSYANGGTPAWAQQEAGRQNMWDYNSAASTPVPNGYNTSMIAQNVADPKAWGLAEDAWDASSKRNAAFAYVPPPAMYNNPASGGWQQNGFRSFPPPAARGTTQFPGQYNAMNNPTNVPNVRSGLVSPPGAPPPQRSRLQSVWNAGQQANNIPPGMCMPPPNRNYNMMSSPAEQFVPPNGGNAMGYGMPKNQYGPTGYANPLPSQMSQATINTTTNTAMNPPSFMGEDSMWQDPNHELRKWQRDTGTSAWGDPEQQKGDVRRWQLPVDEEDEQTGDPDAKRRQIVAMGWGDLPAGFTSLKSPASTSSGVSSVGPPANWIRKSSQPAMPTPNGMFDTSVLHKTLSSQTLNKISSVLAPEELSSLVQAVKITSAANGESAIGGGASFGHPINGVGDQPKSDHLRDGFMAMRANTADMRTNGGRDVISGNGLATLSEAATATMPRFGDSLLEVATGLDQPKSLFSF